MWSVWQTCRTGRRAAGFLGGLLVAFLLAAGPAAAQGLTVLEEALANGGAIAPVVAVTGSGQIYVAWTKGPDVFFTRSLSAGSCGGGLQFLTPPVNLSNVNPLQVKAGLPSIAASDGTGVIVAWRELMVGAGGVQAIRFRRSATGDLGSAPIEPLQPGFTQAFPNFPSVAADNGGFFVTWQASVAGKNTVVVAQSVDGGAFSYADVTAGRTAHASQPVLASDGSRVHVAWRELPLNGIPANGIWYTSFTRGSGIGGPFTFRQVTTVTGMNLRLAAHGDQVTAVVTAVWIQDAFKTLQASTTTNNFVSFDQAPVRSIPVTEPMKALAAPALHLGPTGRFVGWQETDNATATVKLLSDRVDIRSGDSTMNPAAPSVGQASLGQDGTPRLVASWQENSLDGTAIRLGHTGSFGGGGSKAAKASTEPAQVNRRTMAKGTSRQPNLTVFIEPAEGESWTASAIIPSSVKMNGRDALGPTALVGNKRMVKFDRSDLLEDGSYTITGEIVGQSCPFFYSDKVDIRP